MRPEANKAIVMEMIDAVLRHWWTVVAGASLGLAVAVVMLHQSPRTYEAKAKIMITPQQVDRRLIQSTVTEDPTRALMALEESVISDSYMRMMVERVYGPQESEERLQFMIRRIRTRLQIRPTATLRSGWLAFDLVFRSSSAEHAAKVVNTISEMYITQNRDVRINEARETANSIEKRVGEAKAEFEKIDRELQAYLTEHSSESESQMGTNLRLVEKGQRDLENNNNAQILIADRIESIEEQISAFEAGIQSEAKQLAVLEDDLDRLLVTYSEAHPTVVRKRREIDELKAQIERNQASSEDDSAPLILDPKLAALHQDLERAKQEQELLVSDATRLQRQVAEYERRIQAVALVQPRLNQLQTQHRSALERYNRQQDNLDRARESQFLEEGQQAAQLKLAERAVPPRRPVYPIPQRFYALGLIGGLVLFVGPILALRFFSPPISSESGLKVITDIPVLVSIPRIPTPAFQGFALRRFAKNFGLAVVSVGVLVATKYFLG